MREAVARSVAKKRLIKNFSLPDGASLRRSGTFKAPDNIVQVGTGRSSGWSAVPSAIMLQGLPVAAAAPNWGLSSNYHCGSGFGEQLNREFEMSLRKASLAAALAVSMVGAPVLAQTQAAPVQRSGAAMEDANE